MLGMIRQSAAITLVSMACLLVCLGGNAIPANQYNKTDTRVFQSVYGISGKRIREEQFYPRLAHPIVTIKTINIYSNNKQIVKFSDLFLNQEKALKILSAYCQEYFIAQLKKENLSKVNFNLRLQMIYSGTAPIEKNYQNWNLKENYLQIAFDRAQVFPAYYGIQTVDIPLALLSQHLNHKIFSGIFELKPGDLLFQDLECGALCNGINTTTYGYDHTTVSHVGMVVAVNGEEPILIEAVSKGVRLTRLDEFLLKSQDAFGHPRVMVGRVDDQTAVLIPQAIKKSRDSRVKIVYFYG